MADSQHSIKCSCYCYYHHHHHYELLPRFITTKKARARLAAYCAWSCPPKFSPIWDWSCVHVFLPALTANSALPFPSWIKSPFPPNTTSGIQMSQQPPLSLWSSKVFNWDFGKRDQEMDQNQRDQEERLQNGPPLVSTEECYTSKAALSILFCDTSLLLKLWFVTK